MKSPTDDSWFNLAIILFIFLLMTTYRVQAEAINFTEQEREWINSHEEITVAMMKRFPPFSYTATDNEQLTGFSVELFKLLSQKTGLEFAFETGFWAQNLERFKENKVGLISGISYHPQRAQYTYYTKPYHKLPIVVYVRRGSNWYQSAKSLTGKKIGITQEVYYKDVLEQEIDGQIIGKKNNEQLLKALAYGELDAVITNLSIGEFYSEKNVLQNVELAGEYVSPQIKKEDLRIGIQKQNSLILKKIISKGLRAISDKEWKNLKKKWLGATIQTGSQSINLTSREKRFIAEHPVIKVGSDKNWPPFAYTVGDQSFGLSVDLMNALADRLGIEIKYVNGTWHQLLNKFKKDKIDILPSAYKTESRQQYALYTAPYYNSRTVFVTRKNAAQISQIKELYGKVVAVPKGWAYEEYLREQHPQVKILAVNNMKVAFKQLEQGTADAVIGFAATVKYFINKNLVTNIKITGKFQNDEQDRFRSLHFMVQEELAVLDQMLDKALATMPPQEMLELEAKWVHGQQSNIDYLTTEERNYLKQQEEITICVNHDWMPFERINEQGDYEGTVARFFKLLSEKANVDFKFRPSTAGLSAGEQVQSEECDIVSTTIKRRDQKLKMTQPYVEYPFVIATRKSELYVSNIEALQNKKIGLSSNCPLQEVIRKKYSQIDFVKIKNLKAGLQQVQAGKLFGVINTAPRLGYIIQQENMFDLKISGELATTLALRMGVDPENEMLLSILKKTLRAVDSKRKEDIFNNWLTIKYEEKFNYSLLIKILAGLAVIGLFILYRQYQLKKFNQKLSSLNKELAQANQKLEDMSYFDGLTQIPNRRKFDEVLDKEWDHCQREQQSISLIMLDLDFFKEFNDRYGHLAGDDCLKQIAATINEYVNRPRDLAARYGGEEFAVILPETDLEGAQQVALRIQQAISDLKIEHQDSKVAAYVTVSLGVGTIVPDDEATSDDFIEAVDQALYQAKQKGRNQIQSIELY